MRICVFASGSGGNCLLVSDCGTNLLIDAGISAKRIITALASVKLTIEEIDGVLVTHEHSDHISGLKTLLKRYDVPLYMPHTVAARLCGFLPEAESVLHVIPVGEAIAVGGCSVVAFHTPHDTDESVGYRVTGSSCFALATDMGHVTDEIVAGLKGADAALIEANHDIGMLRYGPYPVPLKRRILSANGHLSNDDCATLAQELFRSGTKTVILGHISKENNTPDLAYRTVLQQNPGRAESLFCAPAFGFLEINPGV